MSLKSTSKWVSGLLLLVALAGLAVLTIRTWGWEDRVTVEFGRLTITHETQPSDLLVFWGGLGLAGLVTLFVKIGWDWLSRREEARRAYFSSTRDRFLANKDAFYVPIRNRLVGVAASAEHCCSQIGQEELLKPPEDDQLRLLYDLARFMSISIWSRDHGVEYNFRDEDETNRVIEAVQGVTSAVSKIFQDRQMNRKLAAALRRDVAIPIDLEVTAGLLPNFEMTYVEFESAVRAEEPAEPSTLRGAIWTDAKDQIDREVCAELLRLAGDASWILDSAVKALEAEWRE